MLHTDFRQRALQILERGQGPFQRVELAIQIRQPRALQIPVGQAAIKRVGGVNLHAGHAQINAHLARHPRQEITAADVWEISNGHFRHCQAGAFGDHT